MENVNLKKSRLKRDSNPLPLPCRCSALPTKLNLVLFTGFYRTSINFLLLNLAVADMTVATFFAPAYIFYHTFHPDGVTGTMLCKLITGGPLSWIGSGASVFTLVAIAIERYYTVIYAHGNKWKLTNRKLKVRQRLIYYVCHKCELLCCPVQQRIIIIIIIIIIIRERRGIWYNHIMDLV